MRKRFFIAGVVAVFGVFWFGQNLIQAQDVSSNLIDQIKINCSQIKVRLKQVQVRDALSRVNYGQAYESISLNIINPVNTRLVANNLRPVELLRISSEYDKNLATFRRDYVVYEEELSNLINTSCEDQPKMFYEGLVKVRAQRQALNILTKKLNAQINTYRIKFKEFINENQKTN